MSTWLNQLGSIALGLTARDVSAIGAVTSNNGVRTQLGIGSLEQAGPRALTSQK